MLAINKILVPTDYSVCAQAALMHALHLAQACEAEVLLLHVVEGAYGYDHDLYYPEVSIDYAGQMEKALFGVHAGQETAAMWNEVSIKRFTEERTEASPAILEYIRKYDIDLVVMGTHGHRSVDRFLNDHEDLWPIGVTSERIIEIAPCPVLTVGPRGSRMPDLIEQILVPVDFSEHAKTALAYARILAALYKARLVLLHVDEPLRSSVNGIDAPPKHQKDKGGLERFFNEVPGPTVEARFYRRKGAPAKIITEFAAQEHINLIVLSSHGQKSIETLRLGGEAERVVRAAPCPVFTAKAFGKSLLPGTGNALRPGKQRPSVASTP